MKKINLNNIVIIFTMTIIFSFLTFNNIYKQNINYLSIMSNNYQSDTFLNILVDDKTQTELEYIENNYNDYSIHLKIDDNHRFVGVFGNVVEPKLSNGRFLRQSDNGNNVCVVGFEVDKKINDIYIFNQIEYKVVGVISKDDQVLENKVYFSIQQNDVYSNKEYGIDSYENNDLFEYLNNNPNLNKISDSSIIFASDFTGVDVIVWIIVCFFLITILSISSYYVEMKREVIKIKIIFGCGKMKIFIDLLIEYLLLILFSYSLTFIFTKQLIEMSYILLVIIISMISIYLPTSNIYKKLRYKINE